MTSLTDRLFIAWAKRKFKGTLLAYVSSEKKYRHPEDIDPRKFIVVK